MRVAHTHTTDGTGIEDGSKRARADVDFSMSQEARTNRELFIEIVLRCVVLRRNVNIMGNRA
jgi:hypothetical protein